MPDRLLVEGVDGRIGVSLRRIAEIDHDLVDLLAGSAPSSSMMIILVPKGRLPDARSSCQRGCCPR